MITLKKIQLLIYLQAAEFLFAPIRTLSGLKAFWIDYQILFVLRYITDLELR